MHRKTTKNPSPSAPTSAAAQLLLRRGGREAAGGESIEFFSALRKCQPEPRVSGQTGGRQDEKRFCNAAERAPGRPADGRGKATRRGGRGGSDELLSSEIGRHDYDWAADCSGDASLVPGDERLWSPGRCHGAEPAGKS
ncbi:hypothetical protein ACP70R_031920 [Stipagrostis hirtigluma subsp. patula]